MTANRRKLLGFLLVLTVLGFWILCFAPHLYSDDDALYIMLAKSLLEEGRLAALQVVGEPPLTNQPLLSVFLSPILYLFREFPSNLVPLVLWASLLAGVVAFALLSVYLRHQALLDSSGRWWVLVLSATSYGLIPYVTQHPMTEVLYLLLTLAVLLLLHKYERSNAILTPIPFALGLGLAASYYTRAIGITLILASLFYLAVWQRQIRKAVLLLAIVALFISPWALRNYSLGASPLGGRYSELLWRESYWTPASNTISGPLALIPRAVSNSWAHISSTLPTLFVPWLSHPQLQPVLDRTHLTWMVAGVGMAIAGAIVVGYAASLSRKVEVLHIYALLYAIMIILTPWVTVRNWVPLLPFLYMWFVMGIGALGAWLQRKTHLRMFERKRWIPLVLVILLLSSLIRDVGHLRRGAAFRRLGMPWSPRERALSRAAEWIVGNTGPDALVLHIQPLHQFLYTGRQTTPTLASNDPVQISTLDPALVISDIYESFDYVLRDSEKDILPGVADEVRSQTGRLEKVYDTGGEPHVTIYRVRRPP
jgi:hypothetical protein